MTDLALKYNLLDNAAKKEVLDFVDFLLTKETKSKKSLKESYKKKILKVLVWSDLDINCFQNGNSCFKASPLTN